MRRVAIAMLVVLGMVVVVSIATYGWVCTPSGNAWVLEEALARIAPENGSLTIGKLDTDVMTHIRVEDVSLRDSAGVEHVGADVIEAWFSLGGLPGKVIVVRRLEIHGTRVALDGGDFDGMWPSSGESTGWKGIGVDILADAIVADGNVRVREWPGDALALSGSASIRGKVIAWNEVELGGVFRGWPLGVDTGGSWDGTRLDVANALLLLGPSGIVASGTLDGNVLALGLSGGRIDAAVIDTLLPKPSGLHGAIYVQGDISGTLLDPSVTLSLATVGGNVEVDGHFNVSEQRWAAHATPHSLDLAAFSPVEAVVDGEVAVSGQGITWPAGITAEATTDSTIQVKGETLDLHAIATLSAGVVTAAEVRASVEGADVIGTGTVDIVGESGTAALSLARLDLARIPNAGLRGSARFSGKLMGSWSDGVVRGSADGLLSAAQVATRGVTIATLRGPVVGEWDGKAGGGTAELDITGIGGNGFHIDAAQLAGSGAFDGTPHADVTGTVTGVRVGEFTAATGMLTAGIADGVAHADVSLNDPDRAVLGVTGTYALADGNVRITALHASPIPGIDWTGEGEQSFKIDTDGIVDTHVRLRTASASVAVDGDLHRRGRSQLVLAVEAFDLGELAQLLPEQFAGYAGRVDVHAGITGPPSRLLTEGQFSATGLTIPGACEAADVSLAAAVTDGNAHVDGEFGKGGRLASLSLDAPLVIGFDRVHLDENGKLRASLLFPPASSERWADVTHRELPPFRASGELRVGGSVAAPALGLTLTGAVPAGETDPIWLHGDLDVEVVDDLATVRGGLEEGFLPRAQIGGTLAAHLRGVTSWLQGRASKPDLTTLLGDLNIALIPTQLPLSAIRPFLAIPAGIEGDLNGAVLLTGEVKRPLLQGGVNLSGARVGALPVDVATAELHPDGEGYAGSVHFELAKGKLEIEGHVPVTTSDALALTVSGAGLPLAATVGVVPGVTAASGDISIAGVIRGTLSAPEPDLRFGSVGAAITLATTGVDYRDITLVGAVTPTIIRIDRLDVTTPAPAAGDQAGKAHIEADVGWGDDRHVSGLVKLGGFWVFAQTDRRIQLTGDLSLAGATDAVRVAGALALDTGRLKLPERVFGGDRSLRLDPSITLIRDGRIEKSDVVAGTLIPRWMDAKVDVDLRRNLFLDVSMPLKGDYGVVAQWASTLDVATQLDGALDVRTHAGDLSIAGTVEPQRGTVDVLGRSFAIETGSVAFTGRDWRAPVLDLRAGYESDHNGKVDVVVSGTADHPEIDFQSDEYGRDDAFAIVTLGAPLGELGADRGEANSEMMAVSTALSLLQGKLKSDVSEITSFSRLELVEITETGERGGFSLGKDVFVTVEHDGSADDVSENAFGVTFEYRTPTKWYLDLSTGSAGVSRFGAIRRWRF